jgi:hypothetical protein
MQAEPTNTHPLNRVQKFDRDDGGAAARGVAAGGVSKKLPESIFLNGESPHRPCSL